MYSPVSSCFKRLNIKAKLGLAGEQGTADVQLYREPQGNRTPWLEECGDQGTVVSSGAKVAAPEA